MKKLFLLLFMAHILFAIEQVPRQKSSADDKKGTTNSEVRSSKSRTGEQVVRKETKITAQSGEKQPDRFQDKNSNGVNDRREDDFQSIKTKKSKYKELFGKKDRQTEKKPEKKRKASPPKEDREPEKRKEK
ncbi:MAG: hypothetical protein JSU64_00990 [candidate division WOR-3 bacterium]|nr:MAG: hypothetical protein JSU64_00990 [candidate division WOR-3 bacterium]